MGGALYRAGRDLRRGWRGVLASALLIGLAAGVVLSAAAGARRNGSAFDRMLESTRTGQLTVSTDHAGLARVAAVDGVAEVTPSAAVHLYPTVLIGRTDIVAAPSYVSEGAFGYDLEGLVLRDGRLPDPDEPFEAVATRPMAEQLDLHVGDRVEVVAISGFTGEPFLLDGHETNELTIVGVGALPADVVPVTFNDEYARFFLGPALLDLVAASDRNPAAAGVLLDPGVTPDDVLADLQVAVGSDGFVDDRADDFRVTEQALRPQATALWVFAALTGGASLLAVAQVLNRHAQSAAREHTTLRAMGMRRRELVLVAAIRGFVLSAAAAGVAVVIAVGSSPFFPLGPARWADPDAGLRVDTTVLVLGAIAVVLLVTASAIASTRLADARGTRPTRTGRLASAVASALPGPAAAVGFGLAVRPGRDQRAAGWTAVFGASAAAAAVLLATTFSAGFDRLLDSPDRYGQDWTFMVDTGFGTAPVGRIVGDLGDDPAVAAIAGGRYGDVVIDGHVVPAVGLTDLTGTTFPTVVEGRTPARDDELTLGGSTMADLHIAVGDEVMVDTGGGERPMTVVGRVVLPRLSHGAFTSLGLGNGAVLRATAYPPEPLEDESGQPPPADVLAELTIDGVTSYAFATVRLANAVSAADTDRVGAALAGSTDFLRTEQQPSAVANYGRVRSTATWLTFVLAALATASLAHALISSVRNHARDLAMLKVLGFGNGRVRRVVAVQATTLAGLALVIGIPAGLVAGRLAWRWFADDLGVVPDPVVPMVVVLLVAPITLLLANAIAAVPAWWAARARPAMTLRTE